MRHVDCTHEREQWVAKPVGRSPSASGRCIVPAVSPSAASTLALGAIVAGRYRVVRPMAAGGYGSVFEAVRMADGLPVALKVLHARLGADAVAIERFRREATLLRGLEHPNIVRLIDFGQLEDGMPYIALDLLRGWSLREELKRRGPLPAAEVGTIAAQVLEALCVAHPQGLVHRDIKPANVFLCSGPMGPGSVKVLDFGIAKALHGDYGVHSKLTETGQILGTPQYMAPEQVRGDAVTGAADLYALGLLMGEMLTGTPVVRGDSDIEVLLAHVMPEPHALGPAVTSTPLGAVVERAVRKPAEARYGSASQMQGELRQALRAAASGVALPGSGAVPAWPTGVQPPPISAPPATPPPTTAPARSSAKLALGVALLAGGVALGLAIALLVVAPRGASPSRSSGTSPGPVPSSGWASLTEPLQAPDPSAVDPLAVVPQARTLARRLVPTELTLGCGFPIVARFVDHGRVDLRPGGRAGSVTVTFVAVRSTQAHAGIDTTVSVTATDGELNATRMQTYSSCDEKLRPLPMPSCPVVRAWSTVVASGVPSDMLATVTYSLFAGDPRSLPAWSFDFPHHNEYWRDVDPQTCALLSRVDGAGRPVRNHAGQ